MKIAIVGPGNVGGALYRSFRAAGIDTCFAVPEGRRASLPQWIAEEQAKAVSVEAACQDCDLILLAVPFGALESLLPELRDHLKGKVVVDCTNPVGPGLRHGLESKQSGSEWVQSQLPKSRVVKCFSIYGFENFENPPQGAKQPAMLFAGDDAQAKETVAELVAKTGWTPVDVGPLSQALHLEHMTLMWITMVRVCGEPVGTVWGRVG